MRRYTTILNIGVAVALSAGCASGPAPAPAPAPKVQPLAEYMAEASKAKADRLTSKERDTYRTAAQLYPTAKEPWMRLAESYFEAGDYGNAVLAAQEVQQRDPADPLSASVLAVSGLRVATQALSTLRAQNSSLTAGSRTQAEGLTRTLRELIGESVLVPQPVDGAATVAPAPVAPAAKVRQKAAATPAGAAASAAAKGQPVAPPPVKAPARTKPAPAPAPVPPASAIPSTTGPAASKSAQPKNPFDALK